MAVKVGSFAKSTNTSVPVSQSVTGIGFKPRALIMWTGGTATYYVPAYTGAEASDYWPTGHWAEYWQARYWV